MPKTLDKTIIYLTDFFHSRFDEYFQMMKDAHPGHRPHAFNEESTIVQFIRNIVHNIREEYWDLSIPKRFASPRLLVSSLTNFKTLADNQLVEIEQIIANQGESVFNCVNDAHKMNLEVREAIDYALTLSSNNQASGNRGFMQRAIEISKMCISEPDKISPKVGAVIVRKDKIIGEAYRGELTEGEHAEYTLLERKLENKTLTGSTLYVTLEPCTSRNDPKLPCAKRIVERGIAKVFYGILDPNQNIRGLGDLCLSDAGIEIARFDSDLIKEVRELNREFSRQHQISPRNELS